MHAKWLTSCNIWQQLDKKSECYMRTTVSRLAAAKFFSKFKEKVLWNDTVINNNCRFSDIPS